jgi:hypothetical protein
MGGVASRLSGRRIVAVLFYVVHHNAVCHLEMQNRRIMAQTHQALG